jgi:hypothetical protein
MKYNKCPQVCSEINKYLDKWVKVESSGKIFRINNILLYFQTVSPKMLIISNENLIVPN